ncbi:MAG: AAA family ATPase [Chloroflexota bacterium]
MADESPARITRVVLKNYKSIVSCDVELKPLTILVGPNGSGKSNFVDALRFVSEALTVGLEQAIRNRGNARRILSKGRPAGEASFGVTLEFRLDPGGTGQYSFEIEVLPDGGFMVIRELLRRDEVMFPEGPLLYDIEEDGATMWANPEIAETHLLTRDRLHLVGYSGMRAARPVFDLLSSMAFYNPNTEPMRVVAPTEQVHHLQPDGRNVASILRRIQETDPETMWRITTYLSRVLPGLERLEVEDLRGYDLLIFHQTSPSVGEHWDFTPDQMSDGTLRALAILVALFQSRMGGKSQVSLVGIEEPETGLHPAAARILLSAMQDASCTAQVLATTHSADMLHMGEVDLDSLLVVSAEDGVTQLGPIDDVSRSVVSDQVYTIGELLQADQIRPNQVAPAVVEDTAPARSIGGS